MALVAGAQAGALPAPPDFESRISAIDRETIAPCLGSGLQVHVSRDDRMPVVRVIAVVDGGDAAEPVGKRGMAHLDEHLWFQAPYGDGRVMDALIDMGASFNAYTMQDLTIYETVAPAEHLRDVLALEAHRFTDPLAALDPAVLDAEREVVRRELDERAWDTTELVLDAVAAGLFAEDHPYRRTDTSADGVLSVEVADAAAFWRDTVTPARVTLHVSGDVALQQVVPTLYEVAAPHVVEGDVTACEGHRPERRGALKRVDEPVVTEITLPVPRRFAVLGWALPPGWGPTEPASKVVISLLPPALAIQADASDIGQYDASQISCGYVPGALSSMVWCALPLKPAANVNRFGRLMTENLAGELYMLINYEPLWTRLSHERAMAMGEVVRLSDDLVPPITGRVAPTIVSHLYGTSEPLRQAYDAEADVTPPNLQKQRGLFGKDVRRSVVLIKPERERAVAEEAPAREVVDGDQAGAVDARRGHFDALASAVAADDIASLVHLPRMEAYRTETLDNGLTVVVAPFGDAPLSRVTLMLRGGWGAPETRAADQWLYALEGPLTAGWHDDETRGLPLGFYRSLERIAGNTGSWASPNEHGFVVEASSGNLKDALYVARLYADGWPPPTPTGASRKAAKKGLQRLERASWVQADHQRDALLLGPDAVSVLARARSLTEKVKGDDLLARYHAVHRPDGAVLVVAGGIDPAFAMSEAKRLFSSWEAGPGEPAARWTPSLPAPPARTSLISELDGGLDGRALVEVACRVDGDRAARTVVEELVDRRVFRDVREARALTYTPSVGSWAAGADAALVYVSAEVQTDRAGEAAQAMLAALGGVASGVPAGELAAAKTAIARRFAVDHAHSAAITAELLAGVDQLVAWPAELAAVSDTDVTSALSSCAGHEVISGYGDAAALSAAFSSAGLAASPAP